MFSDPGRLQIGVICDELSLKFVECNSSNNDTCDSLSQLVFQRIEDGNFEGLGLGLRTATASTITSRRPRACQLIATPKNIHLLRRALLPLSPWRQPPSPNPSTHPPTPCARSSDPYYGSRHSSRTTTSAPTRGGGRATHSANASMSEMSERCRS